MSGYPSQSETDISHRSEYSPYHAIFSQPNDRYYQYKPTFSDGIIGVFSLLVKKKSGMLAVKFFYFFPNIIITYSADSQL